LAVLVTGAAGFIGFHVAKALLARGEQVIGVDNLNAYYDVRLKQARLAELDSPAFRFVRADVSDREAIGALLAPDCGVTRVVHLAAQAGVRQSLIDPYAYVTSNVMGHLVMLEAARRLDLEHFVYASSSSVYGANRHLPFSEEDRVDTPLSVYAATKRADELMSHTYGHLYGLRQTGLRFFTVYGPWGRPDMAVYGFAEAIMQGRPIALYDGGELLRDFTYIDDIVAGVIACLDRPPAAGEAPRVLNIGNSRSERVADLVRLLEAGLGRRAIVTNVPQPATDVRETRASVERIAALTGFAPATPLAVGIERFVAWFRLFQPTLEKVDERG
jgi:UDP-glucuronate 4-epimerase